MRRNMIRDIIISVIVASLFVASICFATYLLLKGLGFENG
jgi:hypothetical protein